MQHSSAIKIDTSVEASVSDPYSLNPDPAKNLNPDPSHRYFLPVSEFFFKLLHNYKIFLSKEVN